MRIPWVPPLISSRMEKDVNVKCSYYESPLHAASFKGYLDATRVLLTHGVDVNIISKNSATQLCSAPAAVARACVSKSRKIR